MSEVTPNNKLLALLRQKPAPQAEAPQPVAPEPKKVPQPKKPATAKKRQRSPSQGKNDTQYATKSDIQDVTSCSTQPVTFSDTQCATSDIQPATFSDTQHATKSDIQYATSDIQPVTKNDIQPVTKSSTPTPIVGLSKGQVRVLSYLSRIRDPASPSQTTPVGYDAISKFCFLSRSGSRKIIRELVRKELIINLSTKRGREQGSIYSIKSDTQYATKSDTQYALFGDTCSSSIKDLKRLLLQGVIYEDAFGELSGQSLIPYLDQFETSEEIQDFLDIANACIVAGDSGKARPIKNPQGFLIAQLKAGYINPPEGFKSRRVRSQESRNEQLKAELAELQRLKAEEEQLRFEIFKARLTAADQERLEQESKAQIDRRSPVSAELQLEVAREEILREWFAADSEPAAE